MTCCSGHGHADFFSEKTAQRDARRYRRRGLDAAGERLVGFLRERGVEGATVLEVGGGVGAIQLELLKAGAARATNVELSPAYEEHAAALAREAGLDHRVERRLFDFAARADDVDAADVVVLHKVVCCYPDYRSLVGAAAARARGDFVLTFPRDEWWTRAGCRAINALQRVRGHAFRAYVHPPIAVLAAAGEEGLRRVRRDRDAVWLFEALART
ncbi:MAG: SAM-dependent methyltransferase [Actinobacteria bacterium]|nr:SAM-dependent methyltransferase [Actinomycetota bacterium]